MPAVGREFRSLTVAAASSPRVAACNQQCSINRSEMGCLKGRKLSNTTLRSVPNREPVQAWCACTTYSCDESCSNILYRRQWREHWRVKSSVVCIKVIKQIVAGYPGQGAEEYGQNGAKNSPLNANATQMSHHGTRITWGNRISSIIKVSCPRFQSEYLMCWLTIPKVERKSSRKRIK